MSEPHPLGRTDNALIASDRVEGTAVFDASGNHMGTVTRVMIEKVNGRVAYAPAYHPLEQARVRYRPQGIPD
jgi:hypothetical protein